MLTETSNFIGQLADPSRLQMLQALARHVRIADDRKTSARDLVAAEVFLRLRLTHCALLDLPSSCTVLTLDHHLAARRLQGGGLVVNFNHLR